ncbi:MAG: 1-deoxy-D-xylulose-5-phosphate synthase N-terminal domain-containing protein [Candidatus Eremiobacterota bacterium]
MSKDLEYIKKTAASIRYRVLEHTVKNNGGYLSQACSSAEILATLYLKVMNSGSVQHPLRPSFFPGVPGPDNQGYFTGAIYNGPKDKDLDRFFLSPSQYSLVLYATLIETGRMSPDGLDHFNKDGSVVEMIGAEHSPGMEVMSGSLGQGISQSAGIALARKLHEEKGRNFIFMSDGEFQIGQVWEALQTMAFYKLDNIIIYVDINGFQCDGKMTSVMNIEPLEQRLEAFGMKVCRIDGHNIEELLSCEEINHKEKPLVILCDTCPCKDITLLKARYPKFHYLRFNSEEERKEYRDFLMEMQREVGRES